MKEKWKPVTAGLAAGVIAGTLILGIGGRLAMRLIAIISGLPGSHSWGGSLEVVAFGLILGILSGIFFGLVFPYTFTWRLLTGLLFGLLVYGAVVAIPMESMGAIAGFPAHKVPIAWIFGIVFALYGFAFVPMFHYVLKRIQSRYA